MSCHAHINNLVSHLKAAEDAFELVVQRHVFPTTSSANYFPLMFILQTVPSSTRAHTDPFHSRSHGLANFFFTTYCLKDYKNSLIARLW